MLDEKAKNDIVAHSNIFFRMRSIVENMCQACDRELHFARGYIESYIDCSLMRGQEIDSILLFIKNSISSKDNYYYFLLPDKYREEYINICENNPYVNREEKAVELPPRLIPSPIPEPSPIHSDEDFCLSMW